ncbi:MAG: hypothetical protein U0451_02305 [Candidatus Saccharimonadales bacterium]
MGKKTKNIQVSEARSSTLRVARAHFLYILVLATTVMLYDAWRLTAYEQSLSRWMSVVLMMFVGTATWYAARYKTAQDKYYQAILFTIIALDIFFAAYTVYLERGMSSSSVILFAVPLVISALISRSSIFATAAFCLTAYALAILKYFYIEPAGEGIRVQLYGSLFLYGSCFFVLAALLYIVSSKNKYTD